MSTNSNIELYSTEREQIVAIAIGKIQKRHREVSLIETPRKYIHKKNGFDYVEFPYMKRVADKFYPGWSWEIKSYTINGENEFITVQGRLYWYEDGIWRHGDMLAAHRIQRKIDDDDILVDPGNDIKAANTDCMKKAFNLYLNIADDVYRALTDIALGDEQKDTLLDLVRRAIDLDIYEEEKVEEVMYKIESEEINIKNYDLSLKRVQEKINNKKGKES